MSGTDTKAVEGLLRHPVVLALACITITDACLRKIWHDGHPHRAPCTAPGCKFHAYTVLRQQNFHASGLVVWRKQEMFRLPAAASRSGHSGRQAQALREGVPLWEIYPDMEMLWADIYRFACRMEVPHHTAIGDVRFYMAELAGRMMAL